MGGWVVKARRPNGGVGVVGYYVDRDRACDVVDQRNRDYQDNVYYVESWKPSEVTR